MGAFLFLLRAQVRDKASLSTARSGMSAWFRLPDLFWRDPGLLIHLCIAEVGSTEIGSTEVGPVEKMGSDEIRFAQIGSHQTDSTKEGSTQVSFAEIGLFEGDFGELGPTQVSPAQVGAVQVGSVEFGVFEMGAAEVGSIEVGIAEVGPAETGTAQVGAAQVGFAEIGSPVEYFSEDGSALGGKAEIGAAQVGSAQVWSERGMLFSPGIPDCSSLFQQVKLFLIGHRVFLLRWSSSSSIAWWMPIRKPSYGTMPTRIDKEIVPSTRRGIIDAGQHKRPETTQAHQPAHR